MSVLALPPAPGTALAHVAADGAWGAWLGEPAAVGVLAALSFAYWRGARRLWRRAGPGGGLRRWQAWSFAAGVGVLALAVASPVEGLSGTLLVFHMLQHLLLVLVAAPLLVLGAPGLALAWALPRRWRTRLHRLRLPPAARRRLGADGAALGAAVAHAGVMWLWHAPALYEAALASGTVHAAEHATMLGSALLLWAGALARSGPLRRVRPVAPLALFASATLTVGLAAVITLAPQALYPTYAAGAGAGVGGWGLTALEDQQIAGALMWTVGGVAYATAGAVLLGLWLHDDRRRDDALPTAPPRVR